MGRSTASDYASTVIGQYNSSGSPHMDGNNENFISIMAENDAVWRKEQNKRFINKLKEKQIADYIEIPNRDHSSLISKILEKDDQVSKTIIEFIGA